MRPFDLKIYTSNPNLEIITREGNPAKIIYTNRKGYNVKPVVALITIPNGTEVIKTYWENGIETQGYMDNPNDLFFKPVKRIRWINLYNTSNSSYSIDTNNSSYAIDTNIYSYKESAEKRSIKCDNYIGAIQIEFED